MHMIKNSIVYMHDIEHGTNSIIIVMLGRDSQENRLNYRTLSQNLVNIGKKNV